MCGEGRREGGEGRPGGRGGREGGGGAMTNCAIAVLRGCCSVGRCWRQLLGDSRCRGADRVSKKPCRRGVPQRATREHARLDSKGVEGTGARAARCYLSIWTTRSPELVPGLLLPLRRRLRRPRRDLLLVQLLELRESIRLVGHLHAALLPDLLQRLH